jgi:hypothetical protein
MHEGKLGQSTAQKAKLVDEILIAKGADSSTITGLPLASSLLLLHSYCCYSILVLAPIVSELRHVQKYLVSALVGYAARHYPGRCCLKIFTNQVLESFHVFFWSFATIFLLLAFVAFREHQCHRDLKR